MKTPDEIKKGLECGFCHECPYDNNKLETVEECARQVHKDALTYIQRLEADNETMRGSLEMWKSVASSPGAVEDMAMENNRLMERLAQVEMERDAAVNDARNGTMCDTCKHNNNHPLTHPCTSCGEHYPFWKWRGICSENMKEE